MSHAPIRARLLRASLCGILATCCLGPVGCSGQQTAPPEPRQEEKNDEAAKGKAPHKRRANRLASETSPYLLLHAHNPVDWYPWGPEALQKAKKENKLIFLSIGYSSCHWCHVMERESFMDAEIAKSMNENFVCIKVDREERPDIDHIYMSALQVLTRRGGWPMSMFLTPEAKPFYGDSYIPARDGDRGVQTGFLTILKSLQQTWEKEPKRINEAAEQLTLFTKRSLANPKAPEPLTIGELTLKLVERELLEEFDPQYGGFGFVPNDDHRPKFPEPSNLLFLLHQYQVDQNPKILEAVTFTLDGMAKGGIRDHLGGGFHRYSVDRRWEIPHFEKMLYDNGQLASVYAIAYELTKKPEYRRVVDELCGFVLLEMTSAGGGFFAALDAESEGEEGKFYRWDRAELKKLTASDWQLFSSVYNIGDEPNFEEKYFVPQRYRTLDELATRHELEPAQIYQQLAAAKTKLLKQRNQRPRPLTDDKILTGWNGLMITGLADAGRILENDEYVRSAAEAAEFVLENLQDSEGRLLRTYGQGTAKLNAYSVDYAYFIEGLLALHRATGKRDWVDKADKLMKLQIELFWDKRDGGFFFTSHDHESLIARAKNPIDSARPAANSVSADNLLQLAELNDNPEYVKYAGETIQSSAGLMQSFPAATPRLAIATAKWLKLEQPAKETPASPPK